MLTSLGYSVCHYFGKEHVTFHFPCKNPHPSDTSRLDLTKCSKTREERVPVCAASVWGSVGSRSTWWGWGILIWGILTASLTLWLQNHVTTLLVSSAHEGCSSCTGEIIACLKSNLLKPNELKMPTYLLFFSPRPALASSHSMISNAQVLIIFLVPFRPIYLPSSRRRSLVCPCSKQTHYAFCLLSHLEASLLHKSVA